MGAPRRCPGEEHFLESAALPRGSAAVQVFAAERGKHQQVSLRAALAGRQCLTGGFEIRGRSLTQSIEITLQMSGGRRGRKIIIVYARREKFIDGEGHPPGACFTPVVPQGLGQVLAGRQGLRAIADGRDIRYIGGEPRRQRQRTAIQ